MTRVVFTGAGVLAPLGDTEFDPSRYVRVRGMRLYNRTTQLAICAGQLALESAAWTRETHAPEDLGVVMASTFGHLDTLLDYDGSLARVGLRDTNPALMPLAISSAPCSATALALGAQACAVTLAGGAPAALDALALAARVLTAGRARAVLVVASSAPLLARAQGVVNAEGALAFLLEREHDAGVRGVRSLARLRGHASGLALDPDARAAELDFVHARALQRAEVDPSRVSLLGAGAHGATDVAGLLQTLQAVSTSQGGPTLISAVAESGMCAALVID